MSEVKTPWKDYMGDVPMHLDYFQGSMFEAVERMAELYPNNIAFDFMGKSTTYKKMVQEIEKCAKSLKTLGVRPGDKVTIAMPNCPQAIYMFYAVNLVGGIANMIHPLSAEKEIEFYLNASESTTAITLDQFYDKFEPDSDDQLPCMKVCKNRIVTLEDDTRWYWLRNATKKDVSATYFAVVGIDGYAYYNGAGNVRGVRPVILIEK